MSSKAALTGSATPLQFRRLSIMRAAAHSGLQPHRIQAWQASAFRPARNYTVSANGARSEGVRTCSQPFSELDDKMSRIAEEATLKQKEAEAVFMLMQYETFGFYGDAALSEIAGHVGLKDQMARKHMRTLEEKGIVRVAHKRSPLTFALSEKFKERYGIRPLDWDDGG